MIKILAVDTATEACSAALMMDSEITQKFEIAPRKHAELILTMVDQLLSEAGIHLNQLDALAFGRGPGAFTGIRIATGITQGLAYASDLPVIPISTLAALAQSANVNQGKIFSAIDARMNEIYWCIYETRTNGIVTPVTDERVSLPSQIADINIDADSYFGIGSGWKTYGKIMKNSLKNNVSGVNAEAFPQSKDILKLARIEYENGNVNNVENTLPVYLRNKVTG